MCQKSTLPCYLFCCDTSFNIAVGYIHTYIVLYVFLHIEMYEK